MLDRAVFSRLVDDAVIVSVAPNLVYDLDGLAREIDRRPAARALLDLDPLPPAHPLLKVSGVHVTPHVAFRSRQAVVRRVDHCIDEVATVLAGSTPTLLPPIA